METSWSELSFDIAKEIEKQIMPLFGKEEAGKVVGTNVSGDVTDYVDRVSENVVISRLSPLGINIISEEKGFIDNGGEYTAIVDPVDGSYNFVSGIPVFGFSFAIFKRNRPIYGSIYEFITGNFYEGIPDNGAFMNGERIRVRKPEKGKEALSFYSRGEFPELVNKVKRIRVLGAIAVELAYLAKGALDGVVDVRNYVRYTDIAAGVIIAREAGAIITDDSGKEIKLRLNATEKTNIVAVNDQELLKMVLEVIERGN